MRIVSILALAAFTLSVATSAFGAGFIKIEDIEGESVDKDHNGWIDILSVSGLEKVSPRDAASGLPTGKRQHAPFKIRKRVDKATPLLAKALTNNNARPSAIRLSHGGKLYVFTNAKT